MLKVVRQELKCVSKTRLLDVRMDCSTKNVIVNFMH